MVGESLEELTSSFRYSDERIFVAMVDNIKCGNDITAIDLTPLGNRMRVSRNPDKVGGNTYLLFGQKLDTFIIDGEEYLNDYDVNNIPNLVPISTMERIMSIELFKEDVVVSTNAIQRPLDRFYNYIRTLR